MRRGRMIACAVAAVAAVALAAAPAQSATPHRIDADYADNGRLDGRYSQADLRRALEGASRAAPAAAGPLLPFTRVDLMLLAVGGGVLLSVGLLLQRVGRSP